MQTSEKSSSENASTQNLCQGSTPVSSTSGSSSVEDKKPIDGLDTNKQLFSGIEIRYSFSCNFHLLSGFIILIYFYSLVLDEVEAQDQCICWCQGWAEIHIRRPTGISEC